MAADPGSVLVLGEEAADDVSLVDILDHVLNQGVVVHGSLVISLGGVDLIYLGLNAVLTSVETARRHLQPDAARKPERK